MTRSSRYAFKAYDRVVAIHDGLEAHSDRRRTSPDRRNIHDYVEGDAGTVMERNQHGLSVQFDNGNTILGCSVNNFKILHPQLTNEEAALSKKWGIRNTK